MLRSNQRDGTGQEEVPLGTRLGFLQPELGGWFPHCSVVLPDCRERAEASPHARFHSSSTTKLLFLDSFNSIKVWSVEPKCVRQSPRTFLPSGSLHQARLQSGTQLDHLAGRRRPGDRLGDGAWPRQVSSGSHTSVSINDISSEPVLMPRLIDELLDLEQVTRRFLHTAVGGG